MEDKNILVTISQVDVVGFHGMNREFTLEKPNVLITNNGIEFEYENDNSKNLLIPNNLVIAISINDYEERFGEVDYSLKCVFYIDENKSEKSEFTFDLINKVSMSQLEPILRKEFGDRFNVTNNRPQE